jgi:hypothetical protein
MSSEVAQLRERLLLSDELKGLVLYDLGYILWQASRLEEAKQKLEGRGAMNKGYLPI